MIPRDEILNYLDKYGDIKNKEDIEIILDRINRSIQIFIIVIKDLEQKGIIKCDNFYLTPGEQSGYLLPLSLVNLKIFLTEKGKECIKRELKKIGNSGFGFESKLLDNIQIDKTSLNIPFFQSLSFEELKKQLAGKLTRDTKLVYYILTGKQIKDEPLTVFISYSWDDDNKQHKRWVKSIADKLVQKGKFKVILDQNDFHAGMPMFETMKSSIIKADKVLVVFTSTYKQKAENNKGGVGYEFSVLKEDLFKRVSNDKYIPILRLGEREESIPKFMGDYFDYDARKRLQISKLIKIIRSDKI
ncbi:MAG TPA: toll/interleukin-1 receptor domain-containing protein [Bacteroidales bacterium]|nr:toll/interleukin-1 receptor domain-containing protein [Bacteroidales bacterium]HPS17509.1 toll/interleukin-1 receptor domain-containing protein [Bacteroidales bacterium]